MADPRRWGRLVSGKVDLRGPLRVLGRRARTKVAGLGGRVAALLGFNPGGVTGEFLSLRRRGVKVHIVFAEGDPGVDALRIELGGSPARIVQAGVDLQTIEGADHTFNASRTRRELIERLVGLISP
jgi:dienelactone hydrolase